jgi:hypothetical protein
MFIYILEARLFISYLGDFDLLRDIDYLYIRKQKIGHDQVSYFSCNLCILPHVVYSKWHKENI